MHTCILHNSHVLLHRQTKHQGQALQLLDQYIYSQPKKLNINNKLPANILELENLKLANISITQNVKDPMPLALFISFLNLSKRKGMLFRENQMAPLPYSILAC